VIARALFGSEGEAGVTSASMVAFRAQAQRDYAASSSNRRAATYRRSPVLADSGPARERPLGRDGACGVDIVAHLTG
jgi:hypothetical protein